MELFKSGNESQLDVIKRWIDESDVYMLILGGRYGTIEPVSGKSYTHVEYEYAIEADKPVFAVVMNQSALDEKIKVMLTEAIERENPSKYNEFKALVTSKICRFFDDTKDIKIAIHETLRDFETRYILHGWISGKQVPDVSRLNQEIIRLQQENMKLMKEKSMLKEANEKLKIQQKDQDKFNGFTFHELKNLLENEKIVLPGTIFKTEKTHTLLECFDVFSNAFATGISNQAKSNTQVGFFFYNVGPLYMKYGLVEKVKATGGKFDRIQTSKAGNRFLAMLQKEVDLNSVSGEIAATEE